MACGSWTPLKNDGIGARAPFKANGTAANKRALGGNGWGAPLVAAGLEVPL